MIKWLKHLLAHKISINITVITPIDGVEKTFTPRTVEETVVTVVKKKHSDIRFVEDICVDHNGVEERWYRTEYFDHYCKKWFSVTGTNSRDKNKAIDLHLKYLERGTLEPIETKVVHWEGLDKEETKTWAELQKVSEE